MLLITMTIALAMLSPVSAAAQQERPKWDQEEALKIVRRVLAVEDLGAEWDKIEWLTDQAKAIEAARKQDKPIFVYWYVEKGGPAFSPC